MNTKTTEWEKKLSSMGQGVEIDGKHSVRDFPHDPARLYLNSWLVDFISKLLHQSRTELMRKVVGVVPEQKIGTGLEGNPMEWPENARLNNAIRSALVKLAEDEGITLD